MADLKLLTERVVEKEKAAIRENVKEKQKEAEDEIQATRAKAEQEKQTQKESLDQEYQRKYNIQKNTLEIQKRNGILGAKQEILERILNDVKETLSKTDGDQFKDFLTNVLAQFEGQGEIDLVLGEQSKNQIDQGWVSNLGMNQLTVHLKEETIPHEAGAVIQKEGVEYNFLFDELVDDAKSELLPKISQEVFD